MGPGEVRSEPPTETEAWSTGAVSGRRTGCAFPKRPSRCSSEPMNCSGDNCRGWGLCSHMDSSAQEICPFFVNSNPEVQSGMMTSPTSHRSGTLRPLALRAGTVPVLCYLPSLCNSELEPKYPGPSPPASSSATPYTAGLISRGKRVYRPWLV